MRFLFAFVALVSVAQAQTAETDAAKDSYRTARNAATAVLQTTAQMNGMLAIIQRDFNIIGSPNTFQDPNVPTLYTSATQYMQLSGSAGQDYSDGLWTALSADNYLTYLSQNPSPMNAMGYYAVCILYGNAETSMDTAYVKSLWAKYYNDCYFYQLQYNYSVLDMQQSSATPPTPPTQSLP